MQKPDRLGAGVRFGVRGATRGFTLIELMVVVAILVLIAALAVPSLLRSRLASHEAAAIASMRTITTAEFGFQAAGLLDIAGDGVGDYGSLVQLANPQGDGSPGFIDAALGNGFRNGYLFGVVVIPSGPGQLPRFESRADPVDPGRSGIRRLYSDQSGVIRFTNDNTAPGPESVPLQ